ncbi:PREDICTED: consortin-like [Chrysochloris asiatica]|uniref:Consortin-like n=1 Tax=Chrysochloris asiatica TaxID=185453 RepID=A0A9B0TWF3_CHRAS|nr:PREDICTED: consortin-like [Chrysochloris asiatica]
MDDSETPAYNLQIAPQDGYHPGDSVESTVTHLPSVSDENENQLDGGGCECLTGSDSAMGKPEVFEQDSFNNNESCASHCDVAASENSENTPSEGPKDEQTLLGKDKKTPGKRSLRSKKGTAKKIPPGLSSGVSTPLMQEKTVSAATQAVGAEDDAEVNANEQLEAPKLVLQYLFSLVQGEVEQLDSRALPLCLHQVLLRYFTEERYEKAMKFIQLERLYHEQLLANLSVIQEKWETKWKTVQPHTVISQRNAEKGFNEDFERLTKFCTTHQDPLLSKHQIAAVEKSLGRKCFTQLIVSDDPKEQVKDSENETCLGMEPSEESQCKGETQDSSPGFNLIGRQAESSDFPATTGKNHKEELCGSTGAHLELHTQSSEAAGSRSGPDLSQNPYQDDCHLQLTDKEACKDVARIESISEDPTVLFSSESVIEPLVSGGCDHILPALISEDKYSQTERKELLLPLQGASEALPTDQLENNELNELQQPGLTDSDGKSLRSQTDSDGSEHELCENNKIFDLSTVLPEVYMAPEEKGDKDHQVSKETEDYLNSLLEGCLNDTEDSLLYEDNQEEDSDLLQDLSPEEASYNLQESLPSDDSCLSLDDLARRIEITEVVPAEGLVSILKKRNDTVGNHQSQMQQKPSKRRVRFQEIDDNLDQDEVGGGSCILLILLCIATVFLSVGGTALYCTFGDRESPVCTDFADNMDFYYTKLLQGMAELKHWIYLA